MAASEAGRVAFVNPLHLRYIGNKLWVSDLNGDFLGGKRELPDGFIVKIAAPSG